MEFSDYYDGEWLPRHDYFRVHRKRFLQTWEFLQEHVRIRRGGNVLDVAGVGPVSSFLSATHGMSATGTYTDLRYPVDVASASQDIVICTETIEHIKDVESGEIRDLESFNYSGVMNLLREVRRVLKEDGRLLLTTPNANSYIQLKKWLDGEPLLMDPNHVREFSVRELTHKAQAARLDNVAMKVMDSWNEHFGDPAGKLGEFVRSFPGATALDRRDNLFGVFRPV